ncbi:MAG: hypothetical protein H0U69_02230 [Trueperaceae bacterium]|nr:hypothetical protein [Trueperaceae bacterium]
MLQTLSAVQALDLELDAVDAELAQTPPALIEARLRERDLTAELKRRKAEADALRKRVDSAELELKSLQDRRKEATEGALRASTGKEASQFQNQELQFATRAQELEEDTLPLMEELELRELDITALREQLDELAPELETLGAAERDRVDGIELRVVELRGRRVDLAASIAAPLLKQYEQVRRARRGLGLVPVVAGQSCGGCNVRLPIIVMQNVKRGKSVTRCPSCGRILWTPGDES